MRNTMRVDVRRSWLYYCFHIITSPSVSRSWRGSQIMLGCRIWSISCHKSQCVSQCRAEVAPGPFTPACSLSVTRIVCYTYSLHLLSHIFRQRYQRSLQLLILTGLCMASSRPCVAQNRDEMFLTLLCQPRVCSLTSTTSLFLCRLFVRYRYALWRCRDPPCSCRRFSQR